MESGNAALFGGISTLSPLSVLTALLAACVFGGLLGLERQWRDKPAGLRTHMLVSLSAATFALLTRDYLLQPSTPSGNPFDVVRAVAGGAAVLAAGTVISTGQTVRGLTTGAGMWLAAAIGLASGIGAYFLAGTVSVLGFAILRVLGMVERAAARRRKRRKRNGQSKDGEDDEDAEAL